MSNTWSQYETKPLRRDVVDHEMFGVFGDVNKMILGSFEPDYDNLDSDTDSTSLMSPEKLSKTSKTPVPDPDRTDTPSTANNVASPAGSDSRAIVRPRPAGRSDSRRRSIIEQVGEVTASGFWMKS